MEKSVNMAEPDDIETLDMAIAFIHEHNSVEYVRIGVVPKDADGPDGTISFVLVQFSTPGRGYKCKTLQANLNRKEIDLVIKGLQDAKERMT